MSISMTQLSLAQRNDRIFALLLFVEWLAAIVLALIVSSAHGTERYRACAHVYQSLGIGMFCGGVPSILY